MSTALSAPPALMVLAWTLLRTQVSASLHCAHNVRHEYCCESRCYRYLVHDVVALLLRYRHVSAPGIRIAQRSFPAASAIGTAYTPDVMWCAAEGYYRYVIAAQTIAFAFDGVVLLCQASAPSPHSLF
jgi:hypothetical protein